jgi:phosphatidate cytidylyltransferase
MLKQRIITAAILLPIILLAVWFGHPWFSLLIAAAALVATLEFYRMVSNSGKGHPLTRFGILWAVALTLSPLSLHYHLSIDLLPIIMSLALVISLVLTLIHSQRETAFRDWAWTVAGVLYIGWMLSYWLNLDMLEAGRNWVYLALFTTFANDTGAYFIGRKWGRHKLAPATSPGKTWEGAIGGLLSSIAGAVAVFLLLNLFCTFSLLYWQLILFACLISLFAQLGDMVESLLKRNLEAKDAGKLLPGHGGALDRLDSLIFVAPMVYYYVIWVVG